MKSKSNISDKNFTKVKSTMYYKYINDIIEKLKTINPEKIILFGSYANGNPTEYSDLDLIVVTGDNNYPKNYSEKIGIYLKVSNLLSDFKKNIPIDLIVYSKPMYEKFIDLGSLFSKEVAKNGKIVYERINT